MTYNPALGMMGNLKILFRERNAMSARTQNNEGDILSAEQAVTDLDIQNIIAEQTITDLDIRLSALEG